jgi:TM2 domain-containing membrane protein YozV
MAEFTITEQQIMMQDLNEQQRMLFMSQYDSVKKDRGTVLVLSVLLGGMGVDRFMIGDVGMGILKLLTLGLCGILWLIDIFTIRGKVDDLNRKNANEIYQGIKLMSGRVRSDGIINQPELDQNNLSENIQNGNINKTDVTNEVQISESSHSAKSDIYGNNVKKSQNNEGNLIRFLMGASIAAVVVILFVAIMLFLSGFFSEAEKNSAQIQNQSSQTINSGKTYEVLRNDILSSGWEVYKRANEITEWDNKPYPELDYCESYTCTASFIKSNDQQIVRKVVFEICTEENVNCPNQREGNERIVSQSILSKDDSDAQFVQIKHELGL